MTYREPGTYSEIVSKQTNESVDRALLMPLVIGTGATEMRRTEIITRGTGTTDTLPTSAKAIVSIGYSSKRTDFEQATDYKLNEDDSTKIEWLTEGNKPLEGETYAVTYTYNVTEDQYLPKLVTSQTLQSIYGSDVKEDGSINNIVTAASIMFEEGVQAVWMLQVKETTPGKVSASDYENALENHAQFIESVWRIVPADESSDINKVIDRHIEKCSTYEERKERCVVYCCPEANDVATASSVISTVGAYAEEKQNERITLTYPNKATRIFSDGIVRQVKGSFIAAAYAGIEAAMPVFNSKTRAVTTVFNELLGPKLTRGQKNELAAKGVLIFEQPDGAGEDIFCRHQLTTDMSSVDTRENSIFGIKDFASKYIRKSLDIYVGKYNITADLVTKITGSTNSAISELIQMEYILSGSIISVSQDALNPDSIIVEILIDVPYPCNSIKITIVL